jgi:WD40 repeat protein
MTGGLAAAAASDYDADAGPLFPSPGWRSPMIRAEFRRTLTLAVFLIVTASSRASELPEGVLARLSAPSFRTLPRLSPGWPEHVWSLAFSGDGRWLFSANQEGVHSWDLPATTRGRFFVVPLEKDRFDVQLRPNLSPDGRYLACAGRRGTLGHLIEVVTGRELFPISMVASGFGESVASNFSADGSRFAVIVGRGSEREALLRVWDVASGKLLQTIKTEPSEYEPVVLLSADGGLAATVGSSLQVRPGFGRAPTRSVLQMWEGASGKLLWHSEEVGWDHLSFAFAPDGLTLAVAGGRRPVRLCEIASGIMRRYLGGDSFNLTGLVFSPDGRLLVRVDQDAARLCAFELASGAVRCEFREPRKQVSVLAVSPDSRVLATGGQTTVLLWDLATPPGLVVRPEARLTPQELAGLWADLNGDSPTAHRALARLSAAGADAIALVRRELKPVPVPKNLERLIADLDDDLFEVRERASALLAEAGRAVRPALLQALAADPPPEQRRRLRELLDSLTEIAPLPAMVRPIRAVELLERIGTPEARHVLETLAGGAIGARLTLEAQAALHRLQKQAAAP